MSTTPTTAPVQAGADVSTRWAVVACVSIGAAAALFLIAQHVGFAAVFGAGALANATAIGGSLLGLAIGASVAHRLPSRRPATLIAALHAAFAVAALALPWVLVAFSAVDTTLLGNLTETPGRDWLQIVVQTAIGVLVFAPAGSLVASTLIAAIGAAAQGPLDADGAMPGRAIGAAGLGAAVGVSAGAFAIAPLAGLGSLSWVAAAVSAVTAALVARAAKRPAPSRPGPEPAEASRPLPTTVTASGKLQVSRASRSRRGTGDAAPHAVGPVGSSCLYAATLAAAAGALGAQCLWARLGAHGAVPDARFALALLASAMAGIGLGALAGQRLVATRLGLGVSLATLNLLAAVATVLVYWQALAWLTPVDPAAWLPVVWLAVCALPFAVLGVTVTITTELVTARARKVPAAASSQLALMALGGAAGAAIAWLWLLPAGGFALLAKSVAVSNVAVALLVTPFIRARGRVVTAIAAALVVATTAMLALGRPEVTAVDLDADVLAVSRPAERFYAAGRSQTVRVVEHQGRFVLQIDGEARTDVPVSGSAPTQDARKWLATLPMTARPEARSLLAVGLGGGVMLEGIPSAISHIDVIEAEPALVAANRAIAAERVSNPLERPQISIVQNDPRRALRLSAERYDVIVTQLAPGHGVTDATLLSREFLAELRNHLADGGVVAQLVASASLSGRAVQSMAATLEAEFAHVRLYRPERESLIFLASASPIEPELQLARSGAPITGDIMHYSRIGMNGVEDLLAALAADESGVETLARHGTVWSDSAIGVDDDRPPPDSDAVTVAAADPLRERGSWIYANLAEEANFAYLTRRLIAQDQQDRARAASEAHPDDSMRETMIGLLHAASGQPEQALAAYNRAITLRPDNAEARYLLLEPNLAFLAQENAPPALLAVSEELPSSAAAVITARRAGAAQDWRAIADLDGTLGLASVTDAWYPDVVLLRTEWRSRVDQNVEQFAFDALRLIDRVILIRPDRNFFLLRAAIGIALGNGGIAVESSRQVVRQIAQLIQSATDGDGRIERRQVTLIRQNLEAITTNLRGELVADNERRAEEVRQAASLIQRFLDAALIEGTQ